MRDQGTRQESVRHEVVLHRIRMHSVERVIGEAAKLHRVSPPRFADHFDGLEIRHTIEGWGKTSRITLRCPATWWQHLRLALRERWPRLFGRLAVRFDEKIAENGAIVTGLSRQLGARHLVIPVAMPVCGHSYTDDPSQPEDV